MNQMSTSELLGKLSLWKHQKASLQAMLSTPGQVAFAEADLTVVSDTLVSLRLVGTIKRPFCRDELIREVSFSQDDVLSVWHSTTFERPQHIDLVALFDEMLQVSIKSPLADITIWRATPEQVQ